MVQGRRELLNSMVQCVSHIHIPCGIDSYTSRTVKLTMPLAMGTPLGDELPIRIELLNAIIRGISHIEMAGGVRGHSKWIIKLAIP
jgi:hypothetical protein